MIEFGSILTQIWTQFWLNFELILDENRGPFGAPFERKPKELQCFLHFLGLGKSSILGALLGPFRAPF